ncbi:BREX-1 system adenine-specific DNA-methyltransferase PglX [Anabaena sp. UHCC 0399]|uniref:BREX-1 system adenine-specific DNA-methyltransferase PglX n=1 Tax=Anabaena sp. UHCC 0399 TaxID=3110238 RepID=UPI002B21B6C5|nr:BREX-1 system adenine-specific DNA-methyltransferase PglX [Anabaena sp. UHCC 0399]MEA5566666.1 BREX-1 system adenine-specific DNA-methyltransferase PglX [Anabaena sp. UHCC 0399]
MNRTAIKNFAIWARRYLREQVTARAAQFGITQKKITEPQTVSGGLLVAGQTLNTTEANQYQQLRLHLDDLLQQQENAKTPAEKLTKAVDLLIDEIAYTWFNRLAALRFMEVNGYIGRVLSSSDPNLVDPDILRDAYSIAEMEELPGLNLETLSQWRNFASREPNPDEYLYRRLLLAQCEGLAAGIPVLFDKRKNYQALFLPGNILNQDSIVRRLVKEIAEEDWQDIEVVGWLYQFYISERKDEVIGAKSKVEAKDIPAATQLFTPRWIVQYMVENSLGRLWLESHPESKLREKMPYFLENSEPLSNSISPVEETTKEPLLNLLQQAEKIRVNNSSLHPPLTPQELTVIDPACGSGHILVYAFDLLLEIYKEQGYLERDIPALILTHNLYGLDIDERAAQLASFAVLMKARAVNSRILRKPPALNIMAVRSTRGQVLPSVAELNPEDWQPLIEAFQDADNLGSLITPPNFDAEKLKKQLDDLEISSPIFKESIIPLYHLISQAELLRNKYWVVVANPPYMGSGSFNDVVKNFVNKNYQNGKGDLYACYIIRNIEFCIDHGSIAMLTIPNWMFLSGFEELRKSILETTFLESLVHNGRGVFGSDFGSCSFIIRNKVDYNGLGVFKRLFDKQGSVASNEELEQRFFNNSDYYTKPADFVKIPGSPIAYWVSGKVREGFQKGIFLEIIATPRQGLGTTNNDRFVRFWHEVQVININFYAENRAIALESCQKWFPYNKGGEFRRWYGNNEFVVNWFADGQEIKEYIKNKNPNVARSESLYFKKGITWGLITSGIFSCRFMPTGFIFDVGGSSAFPEVKNLPICLTFLNSKISYIYLSCLNPTLNTQVGDLKKLPLLYSDLTKGKILETILNNLIQISRQDWDNFETSWDFQTHPLLRHNTKHLSEAFDIWKNQAETAFRALQTLEEENNRYWIETYGLQDELNPEVPDDQITIRRADLNRDIRSLISYAVGCIMGRYSLDKPGLIHAGQPFDPGLHQSFPASSDAIIPITDQAYFDHDIVTRFVEFLRVAYSPDTLTENLNFIANALILKNGESPLERIRRYFLQEFISDHIQTYKKRPIYWLFTSGKKRAFGALVYLHRYNEDTLARLRTDYVLELQVKLDGEIARAQQQLDTATSTTAKKAANKRLKELQDQQLELRDYQAKLQHLADARIKLDLDDGVAYNYTRFKGLVYEGADLKMADLEKASQWKQDLLKLANQ